MLPFSIVEIDNVIGTISQNNSTNIPLVANDFFDGTAEDITGYSSLVVNVFSDVNSAPSGLSLSFSSDGSNWDLNYFYTVYAGQAQSIQFNVPAAYFKIIYTNGAAPQTEFRLQTLYHPLKSVTELKQKLVDYDLSGNEDLVPAHGLLLPSNSGAVIAGTSTNPIRIDPTGTTAQPITDNGGSITIDTTQLPSALVGGRLDTNIGTWLGSTAPSVGQKNSVNSLPVVLASDQSQVTVLNKTSDGQEIYVRDLDTFSSSLDSGYLSGIIDSLGKIRLQRGNIYGSQHIDLTHRLKTAEKELKVSESTLLGHFSHRYEIDSLYFGTSLTGSGTVTHDATQSAAALAVTATNGDRAVLRTHTYYQYTPNKGFGCKMVILNNDAGVSNQKRRWGLFDNDGIFFELSNTTFNIVHRSSVSGSPVDTLVAQSAWNIDTLQGTGLSGVTLDLTKVNIFEINIQSFGSGTTRFFINDNLIHEQPHVNINAATYMRATQLPLQCEIINTNTSTASNFKFINGSVFRETGTKRSGYYFSAVNSSQKSIGTTEIPLLCIRPKTTYNSITNRM